MELRTLKNLHIKNKKILVRCDFNVPLGSDNKVNKSEDYKIRQTLPTIKYLLKNNCSIILISHLGRPEGRRVKRFSLLPVRDRLEKLLKRKVKFSNDCIGLKTSKIISELKPKEIILLENLRFHPEEEHGSQSFAKKLASYADFFVQDAFGVCHRDHSSVTFIPRYLRSAAGLLVEKEVKVLEKVMKKPKKPAIAIIGGIKIETKLPVIDNLKDKFDYILLSSAISYEFLKENKIKLEKGKEDLQDRVPKNYSNIILPVDYRWDKGRVFDTGKKSIKLFKDYIKRAKTIVWNGPLGMYEDKRFRDGTFKIAKAISKSKAFKVVGGGETVNTLLDTKTFDKMNHVSTGGGAMLEFLSGKKLLGVEVLKI